MNKIPMKFNREQALADLLSPIKWDIYTSIRNKQRAVAIRHLEMTLVYPFLTPEECIRADKWMKNEAHEYLWNEV